MPIDVVDDYKGILRNDLIVVKGIDVVGIHVIVKFIRWYHTCCDAESHVVRRHSARDRDNRVTGTRIGHVITGRRYYMNVIRAVRKVVEGKGPLAIAGSRAGWPPSKRVEHDIRVRKSVSDHILDVARRPA